MNSTAHATDLYDYRITVEFSGCKPRSYYRKNLESARALATEKAAAEPPMPHMAWKQTTIALRPRTGINEYRETWTATPHSGGWTTTATAARRAAQLRTQAAALIAEAAHIENGAS